MVLRLTSGRSSRHASHGAVASDAGRARDLGRVFPIYRGLLCTASLLLTVACTDARPRASAASASGESVKQPAAVAVVSSPTPGAPYSDPGDDCGLLKAAVFPDPVALVKHYVALDNAAQFLESTPVLDSVYACPGHLPAPDEFTVVSRSDVGPPTANDSVARILVRSPQLGRMSQDSAGLVFIREPGVVLDTFVVLHTPFGWRIDSPQLPGRVLGSAVLARPDRFRLRPVVRDSLSAASRPDT